MTCNIHVQDIICTNLHKYMYNNYYYDYESFNDMNNLRSLDVSTECSTYQ